MTDLVNVSDFTYTEGLNIGRNNQSFSYLYGLSDFWHYLFQDTTTTNLLLEATSVQASDIYSKFLQMCTGISIKDIADSASSQLMLEIIKDSVTLPTNVPIISGTWANNFTTIKVGDISGFSVGDIITISGVKDLVTNNVGDGVNANPIANGGDTTTISGSLWNGTFTIAKISIGNLITYHQATDPGRYTYGGEVTTTSIGIETYQLNSKIVSSRFIANRPFLPTLVLEEDVDYIIDPTTFRISFAKDLKDYGFPSRKDANGISEFSLWFVDTRYDEDIIYEHFPVLLGRTKPAISNEEYRNFLYGLYYIYTSGPTLSVIEKGLNLVLGVPLARDDETVLEIRKYLNTSQYLVITDLNSYTLPAGLSPSVIGGQALKVGDELAKWVEIVDDSSKENWWRSYNIEIPAELMPDVPVGHSRLVTGVAGDYGDWLMANYLKKNTFLVKVNVPSTTFASIQKFENISSILKELRPNHTFPLFYYHDGSILAIIGTAVNISSGTILAGLGVSLSGVTSITSVSTVGSGLLVVSVSGSSSVGNLGGIIRQVPLLGVQANVTAGNVALGDSATAVSSTSAAGTVVPGMSHTASGVSSTGGTQQIFSGVTVAITGTMSTASIHNIATVTSIDSPFISVGIAVTPGNVV